MRSVVVLLMVVALLAGCRRSERAAIESKCDAPLRHAVEGLARANPDSVLDVLGRATESLDDKRKRALVDAGAVSARVTGDTFAARVPVRRMGQFASLEFVKSLSLAQTSEPLAP